MAVAEAKITPRLKQRYETEIRQHMQERFQYKSAMQVPRILKITVNMGVGDAKQDSNMLQAAIDQLQTIAGQRPNVRRARKSIANFKLREEMPVGVAVTLRGPRMWEFLDRLTSIAIPRIRDFRGLNPKAFDGRGNYNLGVREQIIFPEIDYDAIDQTRGMDISITTTAATDEEAYELLLALGMPFRSAEGDESSAAARRLEAEHKAKSEAEQAALEQLKEENPEAYAKPDKAPEDEGDDAAAPASTDDQETT